MGVKEILLERREKEGIAKGKAEGRHEEAVEIALQMLADNLPVEQIVKYTKLTIEEAFHLGHQNEEYGKKQNNLHRTWRN